MRLKRIKLAGFKSFVDPTSIPFPDAMTAVVGPNGCGKSNVIDAVRWVLGESSAKNLRGDAMTDVIFNGSSARKPVSQCSVELVFDNSSGRIQGEYANYNELSVKRLVTRDGQSNYFLNASKCRKRDITDLFLGTGLGPRSYAIIEQGMISRLIESKPQELRVFIEEAAGVSKYKERRRETENRIRHSKENLERLEDVRGELGQQLEKLQRQAAAAKRYKELKAKERRLKGELAALRWLKHSQHVEQLQGKMSQQEAQIEAFVAQQRGDEKGITEYRVKQEELKQQLSDVQQQVFNLSHDITRIEQNQIHAKQRRQQIEQELVKLEDNLAIAEQQKLENDAQLAVLDNDIDDIMPEQMLLDEQHEQLQMTLAEAEDALEQHLNAWQQQDNQFNQLKQQVQQRHSRIQSTLDMQMRTQQRISELESELNELGDDALSEQIDSLQLQLEAASEALEIAALDKQERTERRDAAQALSQQHQQQQIDENAQLQGLMAQATALQTLVAGKSGSQDAEQQFYDQDLAFTPFWQHLQVDPKWQDAFDSVCQQWQGAFVLPKPLQDKALIGIKSAQLLFQDQFSSTKPANTLAECTLNQQAPVVFNYIRLADSLPEAIALLPQIAEHESVVTPDGVWLGKDWAHMPNAVESVDDNDKPDKRGKSEGVLALASRLKTVQDQQANQEGQLAQTEQVLEEANAKLAQANTELEQAEREYVQVQQQQSQLQQQHQLLDFQRQQQQSRQLKLSQSLAEQQQTLAQEGQQLEELALQVEELEGELLEVEDNREQQQAHKASLQDNLSHTRAQLQSLEQQKHALALQLQGKQSQRQNLQHNQQRDTQQLNEMRERQQALRDEAQMLSLPLEEQAESLTELLEKRSLAELQKDEISDTLAEVEQLLNEAEKGQHGVREKLQKMRDELASSKLEYEGYRVRASAIMEQLQETNQSLKPILESLPEEAEEGIWQQDLDKTSAAISRLGAVNLAAVEEFEVQSERKQHLDAQNADLVAALETLENAIRKIDKETRSRFKDTFERVNDDLKALFPKVFGGGSAYLDLTDDDLLETGVTIMARPPGKKNSTIHLLSGGEKALTALSLVFAIFRLNPAPFCLLDEVDAPLDDANVGRFCKLVSEMSKSVQFIYITHNKIAMEMASHLTGVTMAEPGVSRMVAVDIDEAVAIAQA